MCFAFNHLLAVIGTRQRFSRTRVHRRSGQNSEARCDAHTLARWQAARAQAQQWSSLGENLRQPFHRRKESGCNHHLQPYQKRSNLLFI